MQRKKGPRLWLEQRTGRESVWHIRDGEEKFSLGLSASQLAEAEQKLAEYIAQKHGPEAYKAKAEQISIPEVLAFYAKGLTKNAERKNTAAVRRGTETRKVHIANLLTFWVDKTLADVKTSTCEAYEAHRQAMPPCRGMRKSSEKISPATIRQELKTLGRAIKAWHGESPLAALPIVWKPDASPPRQRYLERAEVAKMLRAARRLGFTHLIRYVLIGIYTGTRDDAMRRLRWIKASHDGWIDVDRGILYRAGFAEEQTSKRRPPMIFPDRLLSHVRRWARLDQAQGLTHVVTYLKRAEEGSRRAKLNAKMNVRRIPQPVGDIHKAWASMVSAAGLGPDVTPHTLKHTAITWMLWEGRSIWDVSEDTGTSAKTIEEVYGHHRKIESKMHRSTRRKA